MVRKRYSDNMGRGMQLLDTVTGLTVEVPESVACAEQDDMGRFMWTDGNYSCDCNRALFHARARGVPEPPNPPCGDERFVLSEAPWMDVDLVISRLRKERFDGAKE